MQAQRHLFDGHTARMVDLYTRAIETTYRVTWEQLRGHARTARLVRARQMLMYVLYVDGGMTAMQVARLLDRDHSTVLYGIGRVRAALGSKTGQEALERVRDEYRLVYRIDTDRSQRRPQMRQLWRLALPVREVGVWA